jgi:hypothetical protein
VQILQHFHPGEMELKSHANSASQYVHRINSFGVNTMKRRDFLKILLAAIVSLFGNKVGAEKPPEPELKAAMFWRKLD